MRKVLLALFVVVLFFAIYQVLTPILSADPDFSSLVVRDVLVVSLLIATLALILALVALLRASRVQRQTEDRLIAIDRALSDFANRADVAALSMADLARATHRDIVSMRQQMDDGEVTDTSPPDNIRTRSGKVVPIKIEQPAPDKEEEPAGAGSLRRLIETDEPRLSLQPIVDVVESHPIAFEAYATYGPAGESLDIQRASGLPDELQAKLAETLLVKSAEAVRRIAESDTDAIHRIHVPLGKSFTSGADGRSIDIAIGELNAPHSDRLVLSLPLSVIADGKIPQAGGRRRPILACESDSFPGDRMPMLAEADIRWLKLPAKAVLGEADSERYSFICGPLGIDLIVTHVHDQEQAVSLLDRGFRYMSGPHFGIPRPLRNVASPGEAQEP